VVPVAATVELVLVIDYSLWKKMSSRVAGNETDAMVDVLLYYAHMVEIVSSY